MIFFKQRNSHHLSAHCQTGAHSIQCMCTKLVHYCCLGGLNKSFIQLQNWPVTIKFIISHNVFSKLSRNLGFSFPPWMVTKLCLFASSLVWNKTELRIMRRSHCSGKWYLCCGEGRWQMILFQSEKWRKF